MVTGRLTIPTADGDLLHYSAVASEPLESASKAPAAEVAASPVSGGQQHWRVWGWSCGGRTKGVVQERIGEVLSRLK